MKIIVAGGRMFDNYSLLCSKLDNYLSEINEEITIVSGKANGADMLGERYAKSRGFKIIAFPANWDKHGKKAGFLRNEQMAKYANALVAFWDGRSKGTSSMIELAKAYGLKVRIVKYDNTLPVLQYLQEEPKL